MLRVAAAGTNRITSYNVCYTKLVRILAKIEKDSALEEIEGIIEAADGIMVARGDLGVELPFEEVPLVQKRLVITSYSIHYTKLYDVLAVEGHGEKPQALGKGLDVKLLARAEAAREESYNFV